MKRCLSNLLSLKKFQQFIRTGFVLVEYITWIIFLRSLFSLETYSDIIVRSVAISATVLEIMMFLRVLAFILINSKYTELNRI